MPEERKLVTVLFADIVGSTELGLAHDPEVVRATLSRAFDAASEVLRGHGGTVEKFIGDAVMAVFGVPAAHDDDPDRAVRAAFALRSRIEAPRVGGGPELRVRVGVNSGEAVTGTARDAQFLVTGPAVNAAARLQQSAAPGEIVVGELTRQLTAGGVRYGDAREVAAKGIGRLAAWPAEELTTAMPEQHRGLPGLRAPLIGRDRELRLLLDAHVGLAGREQAHLVTVYGPAGSGKSRLVNELLDRIGRERARSGRCLPYGEGITYYAVQLILRADAGIDLADPLDEALRKLRAAALDAFGEDVEDADAVVRRVSVLAGLERSDQALPEVSSQDLKEELSWGLRRYLERRAVPSPLVLVFEDIHWAEPGLLDLIEHLAEWSRAPLLLVCLARPDFREVRANWGSGAANATVVTLAPLTPEDTRRLIGELLAIDDLPEQLRGEVVSRAEGNPLYVEEFLRMLMETGRIERRGGRWTASASIATVEVPPTLQGLITARLDRVAPEVKRLLQRASLAGRLFSTAALTALGDGEPPDPELLRDAIRRDLLLEADERALGSGRVFRFKHVLIRDVAYSTVPKSDRSRLHDRYGRWLEASLGDRRHEIADIVAHHAEQAFLLARELGAAGTDELGRRALDLLLEAARNAYARVDAHAAVNLYTRAQTVADLGAPTELERAEIVGRALLARDQLAHARASQTEIAAAVAVAKAATSPVLPELLLMRARLEWRDADSAGAAVTLGEALDAATATSDADLIAEVMWTRAFHRYLEKDIEGMYRILLEAHEHVKRTGSTRGGPILFWLGKAALYRGDLTQAQAFVEEASAALPYRSKFFRGIEHFARGQHALDLGDPETAVDQGRRATALFRECGAPSYIALADWVVGEALLALGDAARAREVLAEATDLFERRGQPGQIPETRARLARALVMLGELAAARSHAQAARAVARPTDLESQFISEVALGEVSEAEGEVARAETHFRAAVAAVDGSGLGDAIAEAREHLARFLLRHGRAADAHALLEHVRAFYNDPLAGRHRERIDALLARSAATA
jgi:class 3 adenylate cyclase/tetratricopeptide (TPR) repeat protein